MATKGALADSPEFVALQLKPRPCPGERLEDVAVFAGESREKLTPELQQEALAVGEALDLVSQGDFSAASAKLQEIARSSPFADWRLFVRGLISFLSGKSDEARPSWSRLDPKRRPARIARTLWNAESETPLDNEIGPPPADLLQAAKALLFRREAIAAARRIAEVRHRDREVFFTASQVAMLNDFRDRFRRVDSELYAQLSQTCVQLACRQARPEIFRLLQKSVPGPPHDPNWNLQAALFYSQLSGASKEQEASTQEYLQELPKLEQLPESFRNAIACQLCLNQAREKIEQSERPMGIPFQFLGELPGYEAAQEWIEKAIQYYPTHRAAHQAKLNLLKKMVQQTPDDEETDDKLTKANEEFVRRFPDEIESTLWLIDVYLDEDRLKEAEALVSQLQHQRLEDPLAKILPWKLKLREAMYLSRRKTNLQEVLEALREAESVWPAWLRRDWLPFLRAAAELRGGNQQQFDELQQAARQECGVPEWVGDFMIFAALQQMNLPSTVVKPFRTTVESRLKNIASVPLHEVARLASFFWDLTRVGMRYKGYRNQANKVGRPLLARLEKRERIEDRPLLLDACDWLATHRFWVQNYGTNEPPWVSKLAESEPRAAADVLDFVSGLTFIRSRILTVDDELELVEEAAKTENDPFYRFRFAKLAKELKPLVAEHEQREQARRAYSRFGPWYEDDDDDDDDDEYDDEYDDDDDLYTEFYDEDECNCVNCRARRAREAAKSSNKQGAQTSSGGDFQTPPFDPRRPPSERTASFEYRTDDEYDDDDLDDVGFGLEGAGFGKLGSVLVSVVQKIGPEGFLELEPILGDFIANGYQVESRDIFLMRFRRVLSKSGVSRQEADQFWYDLEQGALSDGTVEEERLGFGRSNAAIPAAIPTATSKGEREGESELGAIPSDVSPAEETPADPPRPKKISEAERRRRQREKKRNRGRT